MANLFYEHLQNQVDGTYRKEIRNKAIDEFAEKLIAHFTDWSYQEAPANDDETDRTRCIICDTIHDAMGAVDEIAEQLKGGMRNDGSN